MKSELSRPFLALLSQYTGTVAVHFGRDNSLSDRTQCRVMRETRRWSATPGWACPDSIIIQRRAEIPPTFPTSRECSLSAGVWGSSEEGLYCLEAAAAIISLWLFCMILDRAVASDDRTTGPNDRCASARCDRLGVYVLLDAKIVCGKGASAEALTLCCAAYFCSLDA